MSASCDSTRGVGSSGPRVIGWAGWAGGSGRPVMASGGGPQDWFAMYGWLTGPPA